jgi:hypothetical protein
MKRAILLATLVTLSSGLAAIAYTEVANADPPQQGAPVVEQNVDDFGLIRVHEQGTASVEIAGTPTVNVGNLPPTQAVNGTVNVGNLPATQPVTGTVNVGNLPTEPSPTHFQIYKQGFFSGPVFGPADADEGLAITSVTGANASDAVTQSVSLAVVLKKAPFRERSCEGGDEASLIWAALLRVDETVHASFPDEPLVASMALFPNAPPGSIWCLIAGGPIFSIVGHTF